MRETLLEFRTPAERRNFLLEVSEAWLQPEIDYHALYNGIHALHAELAAVSKIDAFAEAPRHSEEHYATAGGLGLAPREAALCLPDLMRTRQFARGLYAAILDARKKFPGETVRVLYAGTGPYALLALPVLARFSREEVRFTMIEAVDASFTAAQRVLEAFGLSEAVERWSHGDAFDFESDELYHILLSETMRAALHAEPQVPLTYCLDRFLVDGGFLVPARIRVDLAVSRGRDYRSLGPAFVWDRASIARLRREHNYAHRLAGDFAFAAGSFNIPPAEERSGCNLLRLYTMIETHADLLLNPYESGLTLPRDLCDLGAVERGGRQLERVEIQYFLGQRPFLRRRYCFSNGTVYSQNDSKAPRPDLEDLRRPPIAQD